MIPGCEFSDDVNQLVDAIATEAESQIDKDAARETVEINGELYDAETGEFVGMVTGSGYLPHQLESLGDVETFMERLLQAEAEHEAESMRLSALIKNAESILRNKNAKVQYLRRVFGPQAEGIALANLPRMKDGKLKAKTWRCPFGSIGFMDAPRTVAVDPDNEMGAIAFAESNKFTDAVKVTKKFLISKLPAVIKNQLLDGDATTAKDAGFIIVPPTTKVKIQTGIKQNANQSNDE